MKKTMWFLILLMMVPLTAAASMTDRGKFDQGLALKRSEKFADAALIFSQIVAENPSDSDALEQLATLQGWLQRYDESIVSWEKILAWHPESFDYHLGLARVLSWKGNIVRAKTEYEAALKIKPEDFDALMGLGDLEMRRGNVLVAHKIYLKAQAQNPDDPNLKKKLMQTVPPLLWRLDAGYSYDGYNHQRSGENNTYVQIGRQFSPDRFKSSLWTRHEWQNHFAKVDNTIYVGGSLQPVKSLALQFEMGWTPTPNFQPLRQMNLTADFSVNPLFVPSLAYKHLEYPDGNVNIAMPGVRLQFLSWASITYRHLFSSNITGPDTQAWQIRTDWDATENLSFYGGYSQGNESLPPLSTAFNESIYAGLVYALDRNWSWRIDYSYENRPNFYNRSSIGTGLTFKF